MMTGMSRGARVGAQRAQQPEAVERRHHHVGEDEVGRRVARASASACAPSAAASTVPVAAAAGARRSRACRRCRRRRGRARRRARRLPRRRDVVGRRPRGSQRSASSTNGAAPPARSPSGPRVAPMRSAGRCARPERDATRERRAVAERALDVDRRRRAAGRAPAPARARCPMPSCVRARAPSTRWKRSNRRGSSRCRDADAGVARPSSSTRSPRRAQARPSISPSNVNLKAFESRLRTIFSHMSRST